MSVHCSLVVTCWEKANLLALLYAVFNVFFCHFFPCGVVGQVWYLNVSIPDLCLLLTLVWGMLDWLQSLKQFFINVSYHILVASLTLMALF